MQKLKSLAYLRCPEDKSELTLADEALIGQVNSAIRAGRISNRGGRSIREPIDAGLIRSRGDFLYPIVHGIPLLLRDEAISIEAFQKPAT